MQAACWTDFFSKRYEIWSHQSTSSATCWTDLFNMAVLVYRCLVSMHEMLPSYIVEEFCRVRTLSKLDGVCTPPPPHRRRWSCAALGCPIGWWPGFSSRCCHSFWKGCCSNLFQRRHLLASDYTSTPVLVKSRCVPLLTSATAQWLHSDTSFPTLKSLFLFTSFTSSQAYLLLVLVLVLSLR